MAIQMVQHICVLHIWILRLQINLTKFANMESVNNKDQLNFIFLSAIISDFLKKISISQLP